MNNEHVSIVGAGLVVVIRTKAFAITREVANLLVDKLKVRVKTQVSAKPHFTAEEEPAILVIGATRNEVVAAVSNLRQDLAASAGAN